MNDFEKVSPTRKVWRFCWPCMTPEQAKLECQRLWELLDDIQENPRKYELNEVELAVVPKNPSDERTEICILPYHAFKGYVTDTAFIFERELLKKICGCYDAR